MSEHLPDPVEEHLPDPVDSRRGLSQGEDRSTTGGGDQFLLGRSAVCAVWCVPQPLHKGRCSDSRRLLYRRFHYIIVVTAQHHNMVVTAPARGARTVEADLLKCLSVS